MAKSRRRIAVIIAIIIVILLLLLLLQCSRKKPSIERVTTSPASTQAPAGGQSAPTAPLPAEVLTPATLQPPAEIGAGAVFRVAWTGPDNEGDYVTIVHAGAPNADYTSYELTSKGSPLQLTAPIDAGACEVRYVAARSHTVLGSAPVTVIAAGATIDAAREVPLATPFEVTWTGPDNKGDYLTIVPAGTPDAQHGNYTTTDQGSPLKLNVPPEVGPAELRYITGQGARVLARRVITVVTPPASLDAPAQAVAGSSVAVTWSGPGNGGDYITVVPEGTPNGKYANYATLGSAKTTNVLTPIDPGACELRYMTGSGAKVLARRPILIVAATVTLDAPATAPKDSPVQVAWTGPDNNGDYITIVPSGAPEGQYRNYAITRSGSPATVKTPAEAGPCEIRYISGQGAKTLARRPITVTQ